MHPERTRLLQKFDIINQDLESLFKQVSGFSNNILNKPPKEGKWSIVQIMNHLILAETLSLKYCFKKLSFEPELRKKGIKTLFGFWKLFLALSVPYKVKAPKNVSGDMLPEFEKINSTIEKWRTQRNLLKKFLLEVDEKYLDKEVYKHPFGMRLSLYLMLAFYFRHYKRHKRQINAILKNQSI